MGLCEQSGFVRVVCVAGAFERVGGVEGRGGKCGVLIVAEYELDVASGGRGLIELSAAFDLPGHERDAGEFGGRELAREAAESSADAATHIEDAKWIVRIAVEVKAAEDFAIHLLEHGLKAEGIKTAAKVAEVHVEVRTPGCVVGAGVCIVTLKADRTA